MDLHPELNLISLAPALIKEKQDHRVFYKTDDHWNPLGAFFGYREIINVLRKDFPEMSAAQLNEFDLDTITQPGMRLARLLGIGKITTESIVNLQSRSDIVKDGKKREYPIPDGFKYENEYERAYATDSTHWPKAMIVRDSYTNNLLKLLPRHFSETLFIWDDWE